MKTTGERREEREGIAQKRGREPKTKSSDACADVTLTPRSEKKNNILPARNFQDSSNHFLILQHVIVLFVFPVAHV